MFLKLTTFRAVALFCAAATTALAQQPQLMRLSYTKVNPGMSHDYEEAAKLVSAAQKKAGAPWREVWATGIAGEFMYVGVSPIKNMAQFDSPSPVNSQLTPEQRTQYATLSRNAVRETRYVIVQHLPDLSISSGRTSPPALARVTTVRTKAGKGLDFEALVKNMLLPAWKKAGIKDIVVHRMVAGGVSGEYQFVQFFDKYAEVDAWPSGDKMFGGADGYKKFLDGVATTAESAESMFARQLTELGFRNAQ